MGSPAPTIRQLSVEILESVSKNGAYADELLSKSFLKHNFDSKDKNLLIELVNGTLRWRGQLDWILKRSFRGNFETCPPSLRSILEVSLYQIRFLDRIPKYAAVNEGVELAKRVGGKRWGNLVNGVLRNYLRTHRSITLPSFENDPVKALAIHFSHPEWMVKRWLERYGLEDTRALCEYNNSRPQITLRVNTLKTTRESIIKEFEAADIKVERGRYFDDFVKVDRPGNVTQFSSFSQGLFVIQDESAAIACLLLAPQKGDVVLDLCAAPGGKATYIAQLMNDEGTVLAVDRDHDRMKLLQDNIDRLSLKSIRTIVADGTELQVQPVDKILLDAPCSGLGVLCKRADLRWKRNLEDVFKSTTLQKALLEHAAKLLKRGGALVYSTCTIEPEENEALIEGFLQVHQEFAVDLPVSTLNGFRAAPQKYWHALPHKHKVDGVFAVRLKKQ
ncbi:16S rRNA (cytosine(967)-C(5))-methyltransferase RsmB [candidate division KSB1 bacterium]|nr:16S rRNA (cytosine(967)-C(5))-methyltransferase RsmB [candidate division KSB1 bacterium]NIS25936.1 16S rRNA (cytosine(967)-C(5))-methyltransferase RsmB [candidate division KSB1 bacterium]NIT69959.1 16S rRNA (cytosine(967)-C(5))-methyltransferase RsmB [candidate division KSB1 bacterium]NIU26624.1 16S rRNA (cytosine(967)-C(5))-methyltransferase RsmB [candidate division KSB1 bacterium]NIU91502.1 16S rRNA (cytosine(967)-C(5))-methyltransferase RsmB [candidate division KSB1 bacterium]